MMQENEQWVESTIVSMSLEEKVGQIILVGFWNITTDPEAVLHRIEKYHLGGIFHFALGQDELARFVARAQKLSRVPLLVASDYEEGTGRYVKEGTTFPRPMARGYAGSFDEEYEIGAAIAREGRSMGTNYTFSPVVDVNVNPFCPDVNIRAYSDSTRKVIELCAGYIKGIQDQGMIATAKHFPGNGGTFMDQHISAAIVDYDRQSFEETFLEPFKAAIAAGVGSIMVAHLEVPCLVTEKHPHFKRVVPASMSKEVITDLLKDELGFEGIVISDALDMGGVMGMYSRGEANIKALLAGTDLLLNFFPWNFETDYEYILNAVKNGEVPMERLDDAVRRVLRGKARIGLGRQTHLPAPPEEREKIFAQGKNDAWCQSISRKGMTLLRNIDNVLPLPSLGGKKVTVFSIFGPENKVMVGQGQFPTTEILSQRLSERGAEVEHVEVVSDWEFHELRPIYERCKESDYVFVNLYIIPSFAIGTLIPNINGVRLFYLGILSQAKNVIITSFGDPWVMNYFQTAPTYLCLFDQSIHSQEVAVRAWFGEEPITGRMPVRMPLLFERGDGVDLVIKHETVGG